MSLSEFMREKRKEQNMSQRDLATAAGISNAEISRIESGKRKAPSPSVLKVIAEALNVTLDEIYTHAGIIEKGKKIVEKVLDEHGNTPISAVPDIQSSDFSTTSSYLDVNDLSEEELADVKKYILFIKSQRK